MHAGLASRQYVCWADDDVDDSYLFKEVLNEVAPNYVLKQFINGKVLLDFLAEQQNDNLPSLIILDLNMPVMDGREALRTLKKEERYNCIAKVVFTTSESQMDKYFCKSVGTEMLTKPMTYDALKGVLTKMMASYGL